MPEEEAVERTIADRYDKADFFSLIEAGSGLAMKDGSTIPINAAQCGKCHVDNYREWQGSTHASAIRDLQFLAEISKPDAPRWLCLNCHIPLAEQRSYLVNKDQTVVGTLNKVGQLVKKPQPNFKADLRRDAISCATCHVRKGADGRSYVVGPRGTGLSPHIVKKDPEPLRDICLRCHSPGKVRITPTFFCWFETQTELTEGGESDQRCHQCHMPSVERPLAIGGPVRKTRRHVWWGSGIPKHFDQFSAQPARGFRPAIDVDVAPKKGAQSFTVEVTLKNSRGGHTVPTADPERFLMVDVRLLDKVGELLARQTSRLGQTWDFGDADTARPAQRLADNRLKPGEARTLAFQFPDALAKVAGVSLRVDVKHIRMTASNAVYSAKAPIDDEIRGLWSEVDAKLPRMWEHYPMFAYIFLSTYALPSFVPDTADPARLAELSASASKWSLDTFRFELEPVIDGRTNLNGGQ